jgi:hypothetical protein
VAAVRDPRERPRVRGTAWLALLAGALALACAHRFGAESPPDLRLITNPDVRWETGGPHDVALVLENAGSEKLRLTEPDPAQAGVTVFEPGEKDPVCRKDPAPPADPPKVVDLAPRERRALVVRLESCALGPGEYRYEAWYVAPEARSAWAGRVGPERGRVLVHRPEEVALPASPRAVSPPDHAEAPVPSAPSSPDSRPAVPPLGSASLACVDRELARRGLNAWGDPASTLYPDGPPTLASEVERQRMVLERYPDLATLCRIPP